MHELSIAMQIVEVVEAHLEADHQKVEEIEIEIGKLSGIVKEALEFAAEVAFENTALENARLQITEKEGKAKCEDCGNIFSLDSHFGTCPACHSFRKSIIDGHEMKILHFTVEE